MKGKDFIRFTARAEGAGGTDRKKPEKRLAGIENLYGKSTERGWIRRNLPVILLRYTKACFVS